MQNYSYDISHIKNALSDVGLRQGDTAYFSTGLGFIGPADDIQNQDELNQLYLRAMRQIIGNEGTILIPAYSYSIGKSTRLTPIVFDPLTTPAEAGPFPDYFLKQKGVIRSHDPMVSMAGLGPSAGVLFKDLPPTSYGVDSLYARLVDFHNTKCINLGLGPNWIPFLHHADWLAKVPFRYDKNFYGGIKRAEGIEYVNWRYSVAVQKEECRADAHELGQMALDQGIWAYASLGRGRVYGCEYNKLFDFVLDSIKKDPWLTAKGPACDVDEKIREEKAKSMLV